MNIDINKKISLRQMVEAVFLFVIPIICVFGVSYIPYMLQLPLIYLTGFLAIILAIVSNINLKVNMVNILYFLFLSYLAVSLVYSYDRENTFHFLLIYGSLFPFLFLDLSENFCEKFFGIVSIVTVIIAISVIISVPIENCMDRYFWFIVNPSRSTQISEALQREIARGSYSGLAREISVTAFIMNVGIAVQISRYFSEGKLSLKNGISLILQISALILTGKRTMLVIVAIVFCALMILSNLKGKAGRFTSISIIAVLSVFVALMFVPQLANTFLRFADVENMETFGSRNILWEYVYMMISQFWLFGAGFGSYNDFAYDKGLRSYGGQWNYYGHNIYYEALGEIGLVGSIILFGFFAFALFRTIKLIRNKNLNDVQRKILYFSFYIQLMLPIYGVTGNPLYAEEIIYTWILSIAMYISVSNRVLVKNKTKFGFSRRING